MTVSVLFSRRHQTNRRLVLFVLIVALIPAVATATGRVSLDIQGIPAAADGRIIVVFDGPIEARVEIPSPRSNSLFYDVNLPAGSGVRVRAIVGRESGDFLDTFFVIAGAKQEDVDVVDGETTDVSLLVQPFFWAIDPSTPDTVEIGKEFTVSGEVSDPADYLEGWFPYTELEWGTSPGSLSERASDLSISKANNGEYQFRGTINAPIQPGELFYRLMAVSIPFQETVLERVALAIPDTGVGDSDLSVSVIVDFDGDGVSDEQDNCPEVANGSQIDTDADGRGDACDSDDDDDGIPDDRDEYPLDPIRAGDPDADGIDSVTDADDDNDGVEDSKDAYPYGRFDDVPPTEFAFSFIEALAGSGITQGCGANLYCPDSSVTRAQMAVFLERGMRGSDYQPSAATGTVFLDVGSDDFAASYIEQFYLDGITNGCGNKYFCPTNSVTRAQMAVFLLRAKYGSWYLPPAPTGVFADVPVGSFADGWIEQLAAEGITSGCGDGNFCPNDAVTRAQMAVFLARTFGL